MEGKYSFCKIILYVFVFSFLIVGFNANAETIEKNGYKVALDWKESGKMLRVWGMIKNGKICKKLEVSVKMRNKYGGTARINETVNYHTVQGKQFKGEDRFFKNKQKLRSNKDWSVSRLRIYCND